MIIPILLFIILLINYLVFLIGILKGIKIVSKDNTSSAGSKFVSVIIPFRNEEKNILKSLQSITSQNYDKDKYEIIYVDDNSEDETAKLLTENITSSNIRIVKSPYNADERAHKKKALKFAIEKARGEIIITTDADCTQGENWLTTMVNSFENNTGFVSGPVEFLSNGTLFGELQKIEFSSLILVGAGLIGIKQPIICNAANLGFRKSVFNQVGGYDDNLNISSGDDEFLMQKISKDTNFDVKFCFNKSAITFTEPNRTVEQFYQQRKRWASKSLYYIKKSTILKLFLIFLFYVGIVVQLLLGLFYNKIFLILFIVSYTAKIISEYFVLNTGAKGLFPKINIVTFLIAEVLHIPYIIISAVAGAFGNYKWKGREIKR